jgi:hypothetical protein
MAQILPSEGGEKLLTVTFTCSRCGSANSLLLSESSFKREGGYLAYRSGFIVLDGMLPLPPGWKGDSKVLLCPNCVGQKKVS